MAGNRDFLLGAQTASAAGLQLLDDPTCLMFGGQGWLLSHGDALCLDDAAYLALRTQLRSAQWQSAFLAQPLKSRREFARDARAQSAAHQAEQRQEHAIYADVDSAAALHWLEQASAVDLIHGHTHRPADHVLSAGQLRRLRYVLSDWDLDHAPFKAEVLRLSLADGPVHAAGLGRVQVLRLAPEQTG
jgi:UDP-2,3-diacylglucosamine hydrolase